MIRFYASDFRAEPSYVSLFCAFWILSAQFCTSNKFRIPFRNDFVSSQHLGYISAVEPVLTVRHETRW